jgi:hypothetical protein
MIIPPSISRYSQSPGWKYVLTKSCVAGMYCAIVGGNASTAAAKMTGITPAMLTRSGR